MALAHITPIVPILQRDAFDDPDWIFEPKFDGFRGILYIDGIESYFRSKRDKELRGFDRLADNARRELRVTTAIIDGEITVLNPKTGYSDFDALKRRQGTPVFMAFDILRIGTQNLSSLKLLERKKFLRALIREEGWVRFVQSVPGRGKIFMQQVVATGLEGMVAKDIHDIYTPKTKWLKTLNPNLKDQMRTRARTFSKFRNKQKA